MRIWQKVNLWFLLAILGVIIILMPLIFMLLHLFEPPSTNWHNIRTYALRNIIINTIFITMISALSASVVGSALAIIMALYNFKGKKIMNILLILPLAIPPYISAFTYSSILSFTGPIQTFFRNSFDVIVNQNLFNIMNLRGAIFIFTITLYPYVYLIVKAFLENNSASIIENAQILSKSKIHVLLKIILPILMPSIISGAALVSLEVLNDFGVSSYFGIRTFSTAIFQAWHGMFDVNLAVSLSLTMIGFVLSFILICKFFSNDKKYRIVSSKEKNLSKINLKGFKALLVFSICFFVFSVSFLIPVLQMIFWSVGSSRSNLFMYARNTAYISLGATMLILIFNIIVANVSRLSTRKTKLFLRLSGIGYIIPAPVLAISIISLFVFIESTNVLGDFSFSFSLFMLVFAYFIKYSTIGLQYIEKGFTKVGNIYTESSRVLGLSITKTFLKVDIFTIKNFILGGGILIFIDLVKELPLTLILRSFNFQTLSTRVYMFAINEQIAESAPYSLVIILVSASFIVFAHVLSERTSKQRI